MLPRAQVEESGLERKTRGAFVATIGEKEVLQVIHSQGSAEGPRTKAKSVKSLLATRHQTRFAAYGELEIVLNTLDAFQHGDVARTFAVQSV